MSVAFVRPLPSSWPELIEMALTWQDDPRLASTAETLCRDLVNRLSSAMTAPRTQFAAEDYLVFALNAPAGAETADALLQRQSSALDANRALTGLRSTYRHTTRK